MSSLSSSLILSTSLYESDGVNQISVSPSLSSSNSASESSFISSSNSLLQTKAASTPNTINKIDIMYYIDILYSKFEEVSPGFAEKGFSEWLPILQLDHHHKITILTVKEWIQHLGESALRSSEMLSTRDSSILFLKGVDYFATKLTALLLQIYRDAPFSFWRQLEKNVMVDRQALYSFIYLLSFSCLLGAFENNLFHKKLYTLFLRSLMEYLLSENVIKKYEVDFFLLIDRILIQRQAKLKLIISATLMRNTLSTDSQWNESVAILNEYYTLAIDGRPFDTNSNLLIENWRPNKLDLIAVIDDVSACKTSDENKERKWSSWVRIVSVPVVTAALVVFSRLLKNTLFNRRIM